MFEFRAGESELSAVQLKVNLEPGEYALTSATPLSARGQAYLPGLEWNKRLPGQRMITQPRYTLG